jgi:hypothetical protein
MLQRRELRPVTRQRLWQKNMVAAGRCSQCGDKRPPDLRLLCRRCQNKANEYHMQIYYRNKVAS